jgi:lipoate---protein ligase
MKFLDLTLSSPAENLACDEAFLNWVEAGGGEVLRIWEPREHFVVVGYANKVETEVDVPVCSAKRIPIFRRCSGGGTVLQGPGCLNYALILRIASHPSLANISGANKFIMRRNCEAVRLAIGDRQSTISVCGHTDLVLGSHLSILDSQRKFSGNSQRRHKRALLFHGTFLLDFDLPLVNELLRMPSKQPDYRQNREHCEFLTNLSITASWLKRALRTAWDANEEICDFPESETRRLAMEKYGTLKWNFKL